jgi:hypothetical protein
MSSHVCVQLNVERRLLISSEHQQDIPHRAERETMRIRLSFKRMHSSCVVHALVAPTSTSATSNGNINLSAEPRTLPGNRGAKPFRLACIRRDGRLPGGRIE